MTCGGKTESSLKRIAKQPLSNWTKAKCQGLAGARSFSLVLQRLDGPGPVVLEQARQRAVGQQLAASLAARTIVGFILGVTDALNGCATYRAGLAIASMNRHACVKGGDFLGEGVRGFCTQLLY